MVRFAAFHTGMTRMDAQMEAKEKNQYEVDWRLTSLAEKLVTIKEMLSTLTQAPQTRASEGQRPDSTPIDPVENRSDARTIVPPVTTE